MHKTRKMVRVDTRLNESDLFTKPLPVQTFTQHRNTLNVRNLIDYEHYREYDAEIAEDEWQNALNSDTVHVENATAPPNNQKSGLANVIRTCPRRSRELMANNPNFFQTANSFLTAVWEHRHLVSRALQLLPGTDRNLLQSPDDV